MSKGYRIDITDERMGGIPFWRVNAFRFFQCRKNKDECLYLKINDESAIKIYEGYEGIGGKWMCVESFCDSDIVEIVNVAMDLHIVDDFEE